MHRRRAGVQADHRMDPGQHLRHVAHVGATQRQLCLQGWQQRLAPQPLHLLPAHVSQPRVGFELRVCRCSLVDFVFAPGGQRAGRKAGEHSGLQLAQRIRFDRTHRILQPRLPGDDIDRLPAVGHNAVHHLPGRQLLSKYPNSDLRHGHGVGGVNP